MASILHTFYKFRIESEQLDVNTLIWYSVGPIIFGFESKETPTIILSKQEKQIYKP